MKVGNVEMAVSEYHRPVIYIADYYYKCLPGTACDHLSNRCVFSTREEAIRWAKFELRGEIDWDTWQSSESGFPNDENRDDERLSPTFIATFQEQALDRGEVIKRVTVTKTEVSQEFNWWAATADSSWNRKLEPINS